MPRTTTATMAKRRGRPFPDAVLLKPIIFTLEEALQVENIYRPNLLSVFSNNEKPGEVTLSSRDGAVNNLRFLRIWLDLPHNVFFTTVSYLDMFLAKMRVQERFLKCLTLSCLYLAAETEKCNIDLNKIIKISNFKFTSQDVIRMSKIVKEKIKTPEGDQPITSFDFLNIYIEIIQQVMKQWQYFRGDTDKIQEKMLILLEVVMSDSTTAFIRSSVIALMVFHAEIESIMGKGLPKKCFFMLGEVLQFWTIIREIQLKCKIKNQEFKTSNQLITKIIKQYENQNESKKMQKLTWQFSASTIKSSKRFNYFPRYTTIKE